ERDRPQGLDRGTHPAAAGGRGGRPLPGGAPRQTGPRRRPRPHARRLHHLGRRAPAGRTLDGPHLTDLAVTHARKGIPAADASTGEQKALLIGLILAHAQLLTEMSGFAPLLLLDEVVAPLDPARRTALYAELAALGAQVWMTGAVPAA